MTKNTNSPILDKFSSVESKGDSNIFLVKM